jgi:hypothetical protein
MVPRQWWKLSPKCKTNAGQIGPRFVVEDTIFRADHASRNGVKQMDFPNGSQILARNVTVLYGGPGVLPAMPPGVTVVTNKVRINQIWNAARTKWLADHGCDPNGDNCSFLGMAAPSSTASRL